MKILQDKYPKGSIPSQQTAGRYIDGYLYDNLKICAKSIVRDMTFLGFIFSSTYEVGTGKSVLASQLGEAWTCAMKEVHNIDVPFDVKNCVFRPRDLIERSFKVPKYSFIWLDEWEDLHYMSELGMSLRRFFRKCRQLNLFIVCITPNFFQVPASYALSRSVFAIDVRFEGEFERGYFRFFNFDAKNQLYIQGKKFHNYYAAKPNFIGRFGAGYAVDEKAYLKAKREDFEKEEADQPKHKPPHLLELAVKEKMFLKFYEGLRKHKITQVMLAEAIGIDERTGVKWLQNARLSRETSQASGNPLNLNTNLITNDLKSNESNSDGE